MVIHLSTGNPQAKVRLLTDIVQKDFPHSSRKYQLAEKTTTQIPGMLQFALKNF
jgi:hypothetical protein